MVLAILLLVLTLGEVMESCDAEVLMTSENGISALNFTDCINLKQREKEERERGREKEQTNRQTDQHVDIRTNVNFCQISWAFLNVFFFS